MNWIQKLLQKAKSLFSKSDNVVPVLITENTIENNTIIQQEPQKHQELEILNEIIIGSEKESITLNRIPEFKFDENWSTLSSSNTANFFSQVAGASAVTGGAMYAANGLYKATVSPDKLMVYNNGTTSSITLNGKSFSNHAGFEKAGAGVFTPILVFQFASMVTGQYYFNGITNQLNAIQQGINKLLQNYHNERIAKIKVLTEKLIEFEKSEFFTLEDFVNIDKIKMELAVIRYEYLLAANQQLQDHLFPEKNKGKAKGKTIYDNSISSAEMIKLDTIALFNDTKAQIKDLYKDSTVDKFFERSGKKANDFVKKVDDSKFMFLVEAALEADKLYQYALFMELKANLAYKNPDENRIGKTTKLYKSLCEFNQSKDSIFNEVSKTAEDLKKEMTALLANFKKNSYLNQNEITQNEQELKRQFQSLDKYKSYNANLIAERIKIKKGFETPIEIIIDNREGKEIVYLKN